MFAFAALLLALFFACDRTAHAQLTAQLNGRITDSSGAAVPGAKVTVSDSGRGFSVSVTTDESGDYTVPLLQPDDHYTITVTRAGFKETVQSNVSLQVAQTAKIDLAMVIGTVSETITVSAAPPALDSQTSSLGQIITGKTVEDLPLNGRSSFRLIALTPGVAFNQSAYGQFGDVPVNTTFDTNFSINGGRAESNEILIDGVPSSAGFFDQITTLPSVDDTQEFKVESNNLSAAYGRYSGGVINVSTRAGGNSYHGNLFEFLRNSAFDANDWFTNHAGNPIPEFRMNQFGGTIGGPVSVPHLYNGHDRTFFFLDYQGTRRVKGSPFTALLPTDDQKAGIFGNVNIYNPFTTTLVGGVQTRQQFTYQGVKNTIDPSLIDPVARAIQAYFPRPNYTGSSTYNFTSATPVRVTQDLGSVRIDQNVTQKYHLFGRYAYSHTSLTQPNAFGNIADKQGAVGTTTFKNQSFALNNVYSLSPSLLLSVDYGFARWYQIRQTLSYGFDNGTLGFPASLVSAITIKMFPSISIAGGYAGLGTQSYLDNGNDAHAILASLTKIAGRHTLIFGGDGRLHRINYFNVTNSGGAYSFAIAQTQGPNASTAVGGNAYASFLIGAGSAGSMPIGAGQALQNFYGGAYVQDNWRVTQNLTLNLGVRYDGESPYTERHNELNYFDPSVASPAATASYPGLTGGLVFANTGKVSRTVYSRQHLNIAPRVGFAYSVHQNTVLRGGFGIAYAPLEIANNAVGVVPSLGYSSSTSWNFSNDGGLHPANLLRNPYPTGLIQPSGSSLGAGTQMGQNLMVWDHNPPTPAAYQWNLDAQQQLPGNILLDIGYAGSRGLHLTGALERNQLNPQYLSMGTALATQVSNPFQPYVSIGTLSAAKVAQSQLLRPYPQFLNITDVNTPYGSSTYHSAQVKFVKRVSHGLTMLVAYTWSKQISNANVQDAATATGDSKSTAVQNVYDLRAERSVSELDMPHIFVMNATYELPIGRGHAFLSNVNTALDKIVGGWKLTGIWNEQSGLPLTLTGTSVGITAARPNPAPGVNPVISGSRSNAQRISAWFNTAAFVNPPAYTFGTLRRTFTGVRGPGVQNLDTSLIKDTKVFGLQTEFRAEFFNVTNTPHFGMPDMARQDAGFGTITSVLASPPEREIQLAMKISF